MPRYRGVMTTPWGPGAGVVEFPDGCRIRGVGWRHPERWSHARPDFSLVLLGRDPGFDVPWPYRWVRWPDFTLPRDRDDAVSAIREAHERGRRERVDIGCGGGVGRTGTALALVAVLAGVPSGQAVAWVRAHYRRRAVETPAQRRWVVRTGGSLR